MKFKNMINKVHCANCLDFMKDMPDNCVDLVLTDPPYGIGAGKEKEHNGWRDYGYNTWDENRPNKECFDEIFRVSKNQIIWGGNYFIDYLHPAMCWLVWNKGQRGFSLSDGELAWTSFNKALRIFDYSRAKALGDNKQHPTQKSRALMEWCLRNNSKETDLILDPFLGSGTTAVACKELGRKFIGIEISKEYCSIAEQRLSNTTPCLL